LTGIGDTAVWITASRGENLHASFKHLDFPIDIYHLFAGQDFHGLENCIAIAQAG
jgi:hypothetical protein